MDWVSSWREKNYEVVWTEDQSPSLSDAKELMHHRGGAYAETQLIYGNVLREALAQGARHALSVGLGLGYNEFVVAEELLKAGCQGFYLDSLESEEILRESFLNFVQGQVEPRGEIYREILKKFSHSGLPEKLQQLRQSGEWQLLGRLEPQQKLPRRYEVIFFDAFSSKSSPDLWQEDFLDQFLQENAAENCYFSTYACTGALKRVLRKNTFEVIVREGFAGKRNSTLGVRGFR